MKFEFNKIPPWLFEPLCKLIVLVCFTCFILLPLSYAKLTFSWGEEYQMELPLCSLFIRMPLAIYLTYYAFN